MLTRPSSRIDISIVWRDHLKKALQMLESPRRTLLAQDDPGILVTGGAGFIGSHISRAYLEAGRRVVVLDNLSTGSRMRVPAGAEFVEGDLNKIDLDAVLGDYRIGLVNHHAAHIDLRESVRDPIFDAQANVMATLRLLEAARRAKVKKFIFSSTGGAIYGEPQGKMAAEDHPTDPMSPYGVAKLAVEKYLHFYLIEHGLETVVFRYANVYGPGQSGKGEAGAVAIFIERMLSGRPAIIHGDGEQTRDFVFVEDCVEANRRALETSRSGVWNVGTGIETSVTALAAMIRDAVGSRAPIEHDAPAPGEQRRSVLDGRKLLGDFGIARYSPLREGIRVTVDWFRAGNASMRLTTTPSASGKEIDR
jgi:UDP-glucose 4-epimerase